MVSEAKTANDQLDLLMEALRNSIRRALDEDLSNDESPEPAHADRTENPNAVDERG